MGRTVRQPRHGTQWRGHTGREGVTWMEKPYAETVTHRPRDGWVGRMNEGKDGKTQR